MSDEKIIESGPWKAGFKRASVMGPFVDEAWIDSDDFTRDARLIVHGDFESLHQKIKYAEEIANRLNHAGSELMDLAVREAVRVEREACAQICDEQANDPECPERAKYCAEAIRARGDKWKRS